MPGDKPVVGDFNRDGRTDVGVVARERWLLRSFPSAGATWRQFAFGAATDKPASPATGTATAATASASAGARSGTSCRPRRR